MMAFNSNTYRANKLSRSAWKALSDARTLRRRILAGEAYEWEVSILLPQLVRTACSDMRLSVFYRSLNA